MKLFSVHNELPIRFHCAKLPEDKAKEFNEDPRFIRDDYKYLYELVIDKGEGKLYIQLATPSFRQLLYSIRVLWNAYKDKPYDRHGHPVVMQAFDLQEIPLDLNKKPEKERKKVADKFQKSYAKNKG